MTIPARTSGAAWADPARPLDERVALLVAELTLEEKLAQLVGVWVGVSDTDEEVAPAQHEFAEPLPPWDVLTRPGLGQLTRVFGTRPVDPAVGAKVLAETQRRLVAGSRHGIPAIAHEECLSGFTAWQATVCPTPLAWGASFDPDAVERMAALIGSTMRSVGVHQGLSPVLDVARDPRWGRTEESIGEDPYLVGLIGSAYTRGLESTGIVATLKHFAGYSASRGGRNHAPVSVGVREFRDVLLPPFEMALRLGGARSVMNSYAAVDGLPPAADPALLTGLLREEWGFTGVVVADYFAVSFLETMHGVADSPGAAAGLALAAGIDVELPSVRCYGAPLAERVRSGEVPEELVDRAVTRVLRQKGELGLLDADWEPEEAAAVDLAPPALRAVAAELAEKSVVLLDNDGTLPLAASPGRIAVVGPCADEVLSLFGCYAFPNHVGTQHPDVPLGVVAPTALAALRAEFPDAVVTHDPGCPVDADERDGIPAAVSLAAAADVCVLVVGDRSGLFGRGTSGEGCDADDLTLPGAQAALLDAVLETDTPVVVVVLSGRPYALDVSGRAAAVVQAFFPGEAGGPAVAAVLSGRVNPSGKLPIQIPLRPGGQPHGYLHARLDAPSGITAADTTPAYAFGHGLSYTSFALSELSVDTDEAPTDGEFTVEVTVRNTGPRAGAEVVQLYLHDPVAPVARPVQQLVGFARVELAEGAASRVRLRLHADRTAFAGVDGRLAVEPGALQLRVGTSSDDQPLTAQVRLAGPRRPVGHDRVLSTPVEVSPVLAV